MFFNIFPEFYVLDVAVAPASSKGAACPSLGRQSCDKQDAAPQPLALKRSSATTLKPSTKAQSVPKALQMKGEPKSEGSM